MVTDSAPVKRILAHYELEQSQLEPIQNGLINKTYLVTTKQGKCFILQELNPIFPAEIHHDIAVVTRHLEQHGLLTPHLFPTNDNHLYIRDKGKTWRLFNYIEGETFASLDTPALAWEAGNILARFHHALFDLNHNFNNARLGVHDIHHHLRILRTTLAEKKRHVHYHAVSGLGLEILGQAEQLPPLPATPDRIVHGDPKISNILFSHNKDQALCLIDLDTITMMPLYLELGDAMRSWCNPAGEDNRDGFFSIEYFSAAIRGYASELAGKILQDEWRAIIPATQTIYIELAARFCADALNESYFGWNPEKFATCSEHNQVRAESQLAAFRSLSKQMDEAQVIVEKCFK